MSFYLHTNAQESQTCLQTNLVHVSLVTSVSTRALINFLTQLLLMYIHIVHVNFALRIFTNTCPLSNKL